MPSPVLSRRDEIHFQPAAVPRSQMSRLLPQLPPRCLGHFSGFHPASAFSITTGRDFATYSRRNSASVRAPISTRSINVVGSDSIFLPEVLVWAKSGQEVIGLGGKNSGSPGRKIQRVWIFCPDVSAAGFLLSSDKKKLVIVHCSCCSSEGFFFAKAYHFK